MSLNYESIIKQMSLEEKALMMSGKNTWETVDFEKYGIPSMAMSDGPHGLRRQAGAGDHLGLNASLPATCFPTAASVANSWDETLGDRNGISRGSRDHGCQCDLRTGIKHQEKPALWKKF